MTPLDQIQLRFDQSSLMILNVILGLIMFGIALDLKVDDFKRVMKHPKAVIVGLTAQLLLLPALTWLLTLALDPAPSVALGMIMVAACPGGNISNFLTYMSKGDTGLSISMTAVCTVGAVLTTPLNLTVWGGLSPGTAALLKEISLDLPQLFLTIFLLLGLPLATGMLVASKFPAFAEKARGPFKIIALVFFSLFIVGAMAKNFDHFVAHIGAVFGLVLIHNAMALSLGQGVARLARLEPRQRRALTIEVGIQNSGLGLILIFSFFSGLGGMAIIAAWWGIWHLLAGLTLVTFWTKIAPLPEAPEAT